jgi:hypothetical protein
MMCKPIITGTSKPSFSRLPYNMDTRLRRIFTTAGKPE